MKTLALLAALSASTGMETYNDLTQAATIVIRDHYCDTETYKSPLFSRLLKQVQLREGLDNLELRSVFVKHVLRIDERDGDMIAESCE